MKGPVAFRSFSGENTAWDGYWSTVSHSCGFIFMFDPDAKDGGARANTWTYVHMRINESITEPRYGIDSDGRTIRMERRFDWFRGPDGSYQMLDRDVASIYC